MDTLKEEVRLGVMDDDMAVASVAVSMVEALGGSGRTVSRLPELMALVEQWQPTHLIVDLVMPEMDGVQVLQALGEAGCSARIIICSGMSDGVLDAAMRSASGHGLSVAGVLPKPFRLRELKALLDPPAAAPPRAAASAAHAAAARPPDPINGRGPGLGWSAKVDCGTGELVGYSVSPAPLSPAEGVSREQCVQIARRALAEFSARASAGWLGLVLPVSLSCLEDASLIEALAALSEAHDIDPRRLTLQLADTSPSGEVLSSLEWLTRARMRGFELGLSHVGTGRASLIDLVRMPLSELALAPQVSEGLPDRNEARLIAKCVCDLAGNLGLRVTADGVRDLRALPLLDTLGCHYAQGPAVGAARHPEDAWKPMPVS
jgi:EAL domain-containing protein (putative c-di-GMP-specific phosphodiesterase class I)